MDDKPELSIVIPVYNEEKSVQPLYRSTQKACDHSAGLTK